MSLDELDGIVVPYTCYHLMDCVAHFLMKSEAMVEKDVRFAKIVGDATHDEHGKLKKLLLAFAGCHFQYGEWSGTILPGAFAIVRCENHRPLKSVFNCTRD